MSNLTELFRNAVSEGSDTGVLIAADAFDESDDPQNNKLGLLLRKWIDIQTYVRMSQPIPLSMAQEFKALNDHFGERERRVDETTWGVTYTKPVGPYYTRLEARFEAVVQNLNLLSTEPIRELYVTDCRTNDDLALLFRNYRMDYLWRLECRFDRGYRVQHTHDPVRMAQTMLQMKASQMQSITLSGMDDRAKKVMVMFNANKNIARGCELRIGRRTYDTPERVATHK